MTTKRIIAKLIALFGIALFVLNACSSTVEPAETVISKFKQAVKEVKSADMSFVATMKGKDKEDNIDFTLSADAKIDRLGDESKRERMGDVNLKVNGALVSGGQKLDGKLSIRIVALGEEFYFNLSEFDSSDPSTDKYEELLKPYLTKGEHISKDFVPEGIKKFQQNDEETLKREEALKDLFINTKLFEVTKEYGVEKLEGNKVYHYAVKLDKEGVKEYIKKSSAINGAEKTDQEVTEAAAFVDSITNMEMWIGVKDYYLYKGVVDMSGQNAEGAATSTVSLAYTAKNYNKDMKITAPEGFEEFNPITLLMGMQLDSGTAATETPAGENTTADTSTESGEEVVPPVTEGTIAPDGSVTTEEPAPVTEAPVTTETPADTTTTPAE